MVKLILPLVSISITNWNGKKFLLDCLESISKQSYPSSLLDVMVVDNGSADGSLEAVKRYYPWVRVFPQKVNLGFTAGMNIGLKNTRGKYTLILNNDEILDQDCVWQLVKIAETDPKIALAGAKIYSMDQPKKIQCMWGEIDLKTMHINRVGAGIIDEGQYEEVVEADYVSFSGIVRNKILRQVGFLDGRYFHSFEDTDLMIRLKKAGYKLVFVPKAKIWHKGDVAFGKNSPTIIYYITRNNLLIRSKFKRFSLFDHFKNFRFFLSSLLFAILGGKDKKEVNLAVARGIFDFYFNNFGKGPF